MFPSVECLVFWWFSLYLPVLFIVVDIQCESNCSVMSYTITSVSKDKRYYISGCFRVYRLISTTELPVRNC